VASLSQSRSKPPQPSVRDPKTDVPGRPPERSTPRRAPTRREDRLPDHQHMHFSVAMPRQELLGCGGPPQTTWSCRGQKQDQARNVCFGIESFFEFAEIYIPESEHRFLPPRCGPRSPQIRDNQQLRLRLPRK
jgi:hypothetical protein